MQKKDAEHGKLGLIQKYILNSQVWNQDLLLRDFWVQWMAHCWMQWSLEEVAIRQESVMNSTEDMRLWKAFCSTS